MKRFLLAGVLSFIGVAPSLVTAQVTSINAVGYANVKVPAGFSMIANPLNTADNTLNALLTSANFLDTVYKWTGTSFSISTFDGANWNPNLTLNPGEGAFIYASQAYTNTFVGEVLTGNLVNNVPAGFSIRASQVPQEQGLSAMSFPADFLDTVYVFDPTLNNNVGGYLIYTYSGSAWTPSDPTPKVGQSFWAFKSTGADWSRNFSIAN